MLVVYSKNGCGQCMMAKKLLTKNGVDFVEYNVQKPEHADKLAYLKGKGFTSMPVIEKDGEFVVGFRDEEIMKLANRGE